MSKSATDVTTLLLAWGNGDSKALDRLLPLVYRDLHQRAEYRLRGERPGHTLQPTALVNEAYLKLVDQKRAPRNRAQFLGVAAQAMRRILVDHARRRKAAKRGDSAVHSPFDEEKVGGREREDVAQVLNNLAMLSSHQGRYSEAEQLFRRSLEMAEQTLGPRHPNVATILDSLARLYQSQGRHAEAEPLFQRSRRIAEKVVQETASPRRVGPVDPGSEREVL